MNNHILLQRPAGMRRGISLRVLTIAAVLAVVPAAQAALTDIANVPLASSSTTVVKPNVLFTLDDSGSMARLYMPDEISGKTGTAGFKSNLCNTIYYNPAISYVPPKNADGTDFAAASFTSAKTDGFDSASGSTNLDTSFTAHGGDTAQRAYYYVWTGGTPPNANYITFDTSSTTGCYPSVTSSAADGTVTGNWTKRQVTTTSGPSSTDERENFANWYTYYRTRMQMMKSATGRAFVGIGEGYRVGFITINPGSPVTSTKYLPISDFDATQKSSWFTKLYAQDPNSSTPLREALARAGRHFAGIQSGINSGMTGDPMQYSCQQNFTILTTDGYWNGNAGVRLDNTAIGNHDGDISTNPRPMFDGSTATTSSRRYKYEELKAKFNCGSGKTRIRLVTTTLITPISPTPGSETTQGTSQTYLTSCSSSTRAVWSPNPQYSSPEIINSTAGGSTGSLADVAAYYYLTDLRAPGSTGALSTDVGTDNNVPANGTNPEDDIARHQHMTTFTMGLGLAGTLNFTSNYKDTSVSNTSDFPALRAGTLNWPAPTNDDPTALDDLWHAAVNGRGQFFSAADPDSVVDSLTRALAGVNARVASAAAAATSNLEPVAGDNFAYTASYRTLDWTGELEAKEIDLVTGTVGTTPVWSARGKLDAKVSAACDNRTIKLFRSTAVLSDKLVDFTWNTQACDAGGIPTGTASTGLDASEQANFGATQVADFSQFSDMTDGTAGTVDQRGLAAGANLVNFVRGQSGLEGFNSGVAESLYRDRVAALGDIVNAQPVFVKTPFAEYTDTGYADFKTAQESRTPMVYVAANDGMLHAFYAGTSTSDAQGGEERWAFIPTMALPNLYKLADNNYSTLHRYYVDGTPTVGDVFDPLAAAPGWKTILVGGLNAGGKGYYALDVTDPANPKGLWEFKYTPTCAVTPAGQTEDCHVGYSYGLPRISKLADGRWVVFVTSGHNNVSTPAATGDGEGYLYVLDALTGTIIYKISTGAGDATTPSGLSHINNFVLDTVTNNVTQQIYGVDLLGNLWRFEVNAAQTATRMVTLTDASSNPQPITITPQIADFGSPPVTHVFVATGKYIGASDLADTQTQTVWGIKDTGTYPVATPRATLSQLTITNSGTSRSIACATNCTVNGGWYADLPDTGERVNIDMKLQLGTLVVASNVPQNNACNIGGFSWLNFFDARNGLQIAGAANFGTKLSDSLAVGINVVRLPDGRTVVIATTSDASQQTQEAPIPPGDPQGRRTSWRELVQ